MENDTFQKLKVLIPGIKRNVLLKNYITFRIGGPAEYFFVAKTKQDLIKAVKAAKKTNLPFFNLGGGSNLLVSDKGFNGLVIKFQISGFRFQEEKVYAEAGAGLGKLVVRSQELGLSGLEWAIGIPGTVGGAIRGNAGAFGASIADIVESVEVLDIQNIKDAKSKTQDLKSKIFQNRKCKFGYRDSIFKENKNLIILSAVLNLQKGRKEEIKRKAKRNLKQRKRTQPLNFPSAGSIFKNPPNFSAGCLIERCGLKGKRIGQVQVSETHANFIVNLGNGKAEDVMELINIIKKGVKNKFKIELEKEIEVLGAI